MKVICDCRILLPVLALSLVMACGKKKEEDEATDTKQIPTIDMTIPESSDTETNLNGADLHLVAGLSNILTDWQQRTNDIISKINAELETYNTIIDRLEGGGSFTGKGPNGNISGIFTEISDGTYNYSATICVDGKVYTSTKWATNGSAVYTARDMNQTPVSANRQDFKVEVTYTAGESKKLLVSAYGDPYRSAPTGAEGEFLAEYVEATQTAGGDFVLAGVNDWSASAATTFAGDGYLVGKVNATGETGEYVAYDKRLAVFGVCTDVFSESAQNWCIGRSLGGQRFTDAQRSEAWDRLKTDSSLTSQSKLKEITVTATCP